MRDNTLVIFPSDIPSDNGGTKTALFAGQMADLSKTKIPAFQFHCNIPSTSRIQRGWIFGSRQEKLLVQATLLRKAA